MLLVEITINSVVNYVSLDGHALVHNWTPRIAGFDAPTLALPTDHGGYAKMTFGSISFNPILFAGDYPPPVSCPIAIYYTDTTEAARELVFTGTAHLTRFDRESVAYALHGPSYDETIAASTAYNTSLNALIASILTTIPEITTVDTGFARASSPAVVHTTSSARLAIDLASGIAAFFSHLIYVVGSTAYLVDMKLGNGSAWDLTEYAFFAKAQYSYKSPVAMVTSTYGGTTYSKASAYPYGNTVAVEPYHGTQANIEAALDDILAIENAPRISVSVPMIGGNFPRLGQVITIPDSSHVVGLFSWIRARKLSYDFLNDTINIEGEGVIST